MTRDHRGALNPNYRHGRSRMPEYFAWKNVIYRCTNPSSSVYKYYGGRGIAVCDRWKDFDNFLADVGPRPSVKHSIDRIDNDGNYEPGNVRWATKKVQMNNKRQANQFTGR